MTAKRAQADRSVALLNPGGVADRVMGTLNGLTMALVQASDGMLPPEIAVRSASLVVAAVDASATMKNMADYVCDGVADEVQINAALAALPAVGGTVLLSEGTFNLGGTIAFTAARQVLRGMGMGATVLFAATGFTTVAHGAVVSVTNDYTEISDLTIDANKAVHAALTTMRCLNVTGALGQTIQRVRATNAPYIGLVFGTGGVLPTNGVIRDCVIENAGDSGAYLRAVAGQPLVVSGCTSQWNSGVGFICDNGPVLLSDCHAQGNNASGFSITTADVTLSRCTARNNSPYGFTTSGARTQIIDCRGVGNTSFDFLTTGAQTQFVGCAADIAFGTGFQSGSGSTDALFSGCIARAGQTGFYHNSTGRGLYNGCQALAQSTYGIRVAAGEAHINGCTVIGSGIGGYGIDLQSGGYHTVNGCRIESVGGYGIEVQATVPDCQITNNSILSVSLAVNGTYAHIIVQGDRAFVDGNRLRDPAAGNRPGYGILIDATADSCLVGHNDTRGVGTVAGGAVYNVGTNTRRTVRTLLDYVASTDLVGRVNIGGWMDVCPNQPFTVCSTTSLVEVMVSGAMYMSADVPGVAFGTRLLIDDGAIIRNLAGDINELANGNGNPFSGVNVVKFQGLTAGAHTLRVQHATLVATGSSWLRASTAGYQEHLHIQVTEYQR